MSHHPNDDNGSSAGFYYSQENAEEAASRALQRAQGAILQGYQQNNAHQGFYTDVPGAYVAQASAWQDSQGYSGHPPQSNFVAQPSHRAYSHVHPTVTTTQPADSAFYYNSSHQPLPQQNVSSTAAQVSDVDSPLTVLSPEIAPGTSRQRQFTSVMKHSGAEYALGDDNFMFKLLFPRNTYMTLSVPISAESTLHVLRHMVKGRHAACPRCESELTENVLWADAGEIAGGLTDEDRPVVRRFLYDGVTGGRLVDVLYNREDALESLRGSKYDRIVDWNGAMSYTMVPGL